LKSGVQSDDCGSAAMPVQCRRREARESTLSSENRKRKSEATMTNDRNKKTYGIILAGILSLLMLVGIGCAPSEQAKIDKFIAEYGSDVTAVDKGGNTLLHTAVMRNENVAVIKFLVAAGADVNAKTNSGESPLHHAAFAVVNPDNNLEIIKFLISEGSDVSAKNNTGSTPLHWMVCGYGDVGIVQILVSNGADVNAKNDDGMTPLHSTVVAGKGKFVEALISAGADVNAKDSEGRTPLDLAKEQDPTWSITEYLSGLDTE